MRLLSARMIRRCWQRPKAGNRWLLVGVALLTGLMLNSCGDGRTPLLIYSPHGRDLLMLVEETFEAANPGIDVRWLDMGSQEVLDRIRSETANTQCDLWFGGPATIFSQAAEEGLLTAHSPSWASLVEGDPRHFFHSLYRTPPVLVYNEDAVAESDIPGDWSDLHDAKWLDRVLIRDPLASGTMRTIFGMILDRSVAATGNPSKGFDWLRTLDAQTKEYVHSPALLHQKMIRQEGLVTMWELTDILFQRLRGAPLGYTFPTSGSPVIEDSVALVSGDRGSERAQAAIELLEWLGSPEAQLLAAERAFRLPARSDLDPSQLPPWAQRALEELVVAEDLDWGRIASEGAAWMHRWDREVRGQGRQ